MEAFKSLWRPRGNIAIPTYGPTDGVDLQVKSLLYIYKRLGIAKATDKLETEPVEGVSDEDLAQLDKLYNIDEFRRIVFDDGHRVLVDWPKNKFRAMLILAHMPQLEHLPKLGDPHFRFLVLEADASDDEYIRTLSLSDIYAEHNLPLEVRREIAATVVRSHVKTTLEARAAIIVEYLRLVATEIQVARIYKAMVGKISPSHSPSSSRSTSPVRGPSPTRASSPSVRPSSPTRQPSPTRTPSPTRPGSPTRVGPPPRPGSPTRFPKVTPANNAAPLASPKLSATPKLTASRPTSPSHSPPHSPSHSPPASPGPTPRIRMRGSQSNLKLSSAPPHLQQNHVAPSLDAGKKHILQQARLAVKARIDKEQASINNARK